MKGFDKIRSEALLNPKGIYVIGVEISKLHLKLKVTIDQEVRFEISIVFSF